MPILPIAITLLISSVGNQYFRSDYIFYLLTHQFAHSPLMSLATVAIVVVFFITFIVDSELPKIVLMC